MTAAVVLLLGLLIGSFLNVCIHRIPLERSIVSPPSQCPRCSTPIRWFDNIPVLSYLALGGKCRTCGERISWRYPAVELLNALAWYGSLRAFGATAEAALVMAFCSALIVITFIDLDHFIIPDVITLPGTVIGLVVAPLVMPGLAGPPPAWLASVLPSGAYPASLAQSVLGVLAGAGPLFVIGWVWERLRNVEAMGGGDVKLMALVGSLLGWKGALMTIMLGAFGGSLAGGALILMKKHDPESMIPFGPFLAAGAVASVFFGERIIAWYLGFVLL